MSRGSPNGQEGSIADDFSWVSGGPFYRVLRRIGLLGQGHTTKRFLAWLVVTWLPLFLLCIAEGTAWGNKVKLPLLYDYASYGRFFVGLPLLIACEFMIDPYLRQAVSTLDCCGIIKEEDLPAYHASLQRIARLRDSGLTELILALLACLPFFLFFARHEWAEEGVSSWHGATSRGLSPAGWCFVFGSGLLVRFLILRWLWRYALWSYMLHRVSRLNLDLLATHPDRMAGLDFLLHAQQHFALLATALGSVLAGGLANEILHFGGSLRELQASAVVFTVISVLIILFPLTFFSAQLFQARRNGLGRYNLVARRVTARFDTQWARKTSVPAELMVGTQEPSSLIDYISTYEVIHNTRVVPVSKRAVIYTAAFAAAPFGLVWLIASPLDRLIAEILKRFLEF